MPARFSNILPFIILTAFLLCLTYSCRPGLNLMKSAFPHEKYRNSLINAGLEKSAAGRLWINAAEESLQRPLDIKLPFKETGYFAAEKVPAIAYAFTVTRGQKINISLSKKPVDQFQIFIDIFEREESADNHRLTSADTSANPLQIEVNKDAVYLIRLQPELLSSGQYTLEISAGPSLEFPIKSGKKNPIQSFFGDGRDGNTRKHEGVDIFAPLRTPVLAIAEGRVVRVNENNLGGKVVWMRPAGKDFTLYYAHLDEQIAVEGQFVVPGDTVGLMGNTGNARSTAPHLHFGIYTSQGAVDPLPYINPVKTPLPEISANLMNLHKIMRTQKGDIVYVSAANKALYRAEMPNRSIKFIPSAQIESISKPLRRLKLKSSQLALYDLPDSTAAIKSNLILGQTVDVLGGFGSYHFVVDESQETGWVSK